MILYMVVSSAWIWSEKIKKRGEKKELEITDHTPWFYLNYRAFTFHSLSVNWHNWNASTELPFVYCGSIHQVMEKNPGLLCLSWDSKIHEVAQSGLTQAHEFLSCVKQEKSLQEVSLVAQEAIGEFRKLLILLDRSKPSSDQKRIRKGPLPKTHDVNHVEFMDISRGSSQPFVIRQFFPPSYSSHTISTVVVPSNYNNSVTGLSQFSQQPTTSNSLISMHGRSSTNTRAIHYPSSSELLASEVSNSSMFSSKSRSCGAAKSEDTGTRCVASTGGCHCSKRR